MNFVFYLLLALLMFIILVIRNIFKAYVIYMMGDPTPKYRGLLSTNPLNHVDSIGTLFLFVTPLISGGSFVIGWTKYVDFDSNYFKNRDIGELLVSIAGLGSFFVIVFLSKILADIFSNLGLVLQILAFMSAFLFAFNLIPLKGFDGYILWGLILRKINKNLLYQWENFQYRNQFFILIMFFPVVWILFPIFKVIALILMKMGGWM